MEGDTFHVIEVQSDWAQQRRDYENRVKERLKDIEVSPTGEQGQRAFRAKWESGQGNTITKYGESEQAARHTLS